MVAFSHFITLFKFRLTLTSHPELTCCCTLCLQYELWYRFCLRTTCAQTCENWSFWSRPPAPGTAARTFAGTCSSTSRSKIAVLESLRRERVHPHHQHMHHKTKCGAEATTPGWSTLRSGTKLTLEVDWRFNQIWNFLFSHLADGISGNSFSKPL